MRRKAESTLSPEQDAAIKAAVAILHPHFAGETVRLYVPLMLPTARTARQCRMRELHAAGMPAGQIATEVGVCAAYVRKVLRADPRRPDDRQPTTEVVR